MDVIRELNQFKLYFDSNLITFDSEKEMCNFIVAQLPNNIEVFFSEDKDRI